MNSKCHGRFFFFPFLSLDYKNHFYDDNDDNDDNNEDEDDDDDHHPLTLENEAHQLTAFFRK